MVQRGNMSYNPSIPQGTDPILQSQAQIRANFQAINTTWNNNHYLLTSSDKYQGMHNVLTMRAQGSAPTTDATHVGLFNMLVGGIPELFYGPSSAQTPIQLTYPSISTSESALTQYSFVAGPFVVYGGVIREATNGQVVTLSPTTTLRYVGLQSANVMFRPLAIPNSIPTNITGSSFTISTSAVGLVSFDVYYLAIGN